MDTNECEYDYEYDYEYEYYYEYIIHQTKCMQNARQQAWNQN